MRLLFFSMHGSAATDLALLCKAAGVEFWMAHPSSSHVATKTKAEERPYFEAMGAKFTSGDEEAASLMASKETLVVLSTPGQIEQYLSGGWQAPFAVRHGLNSFDKFKMMGTKNFITASKVAMAKMPGCNCLLTKKLIPWELFPRPNLSAEGRDGFSSFIHDYQTKWPKDYKKFSKLNGMIPQAVVNYGTGSEKGMVNDLATMSKSMATVHIKGGNAVCNAVVRSMAMGTPVVMDRETYACCHFDNIEGIHVEDSLLGVASWLIFLMTEGEEHLEEQCVNTYKAARDQFVANEELTSSLVRFLHGVVI